MRAVAGGSSAELAGARPGDRLIAIGQEAVTDIHAARRLLRALGTGDELHVRVEREGQSIELHCPVRPFPTEQHAHAETYLAQVNVGAHRLRAVVLLPEAPGPHPVLYYLPGAHWASEEYPFAPEHPVPALLGELARSGIASVRVDRFGVGDSEGPPCTEVDFVTELAGYRAGLDLLAQAAWCDASRVVLMGHSLGAMVAPLLATDPSAPLRPRGILTFGASAIPISLGLEGALLRYAKVQPDVKAETIARQRELIRLIVAGFRTPAEALLERPDLLAVKPDHFTDETIYRRTVRFYHQLETQPLEAAWRQLEVPVLTLHGSHDWICAPEDSQRVVASCQRGRFESVSGADHQFAHAEPGKLLASQPLSLAAPVAQLTGEWLRQLFATTSGP